MKLLVSTIRIVEIYRWMRINTNIASLAAQRQLGSVSKALGRSLERLSSGQRINRAGDDAAGLAISSRISAEARGLRQAVRNTNDSLGFLSVSEGAMRVQIDIVQRMRELAMQAANGAIGNTERSFLNTELQQLLQEFDRITAQTEFNGTKVLSTPQKFSLQVGNRKDSTIELELQTTTRAEIFKTTKPQGTGKFEESPASFTGSWSASTQATASGKDLLVSVEAGGVLRFYESDQAGGLRAVQELETSDEVQIAPAFYDLTGNGRDELFVIDKAGLRIFESDASGFWSERAFFSDVEDFDVGDMTGDGSLDLAVRKGENIQTFLNQGNGDLEVASILFSATSSATNPGGQHGNSFALADLNGDGRADLVTLLVSDFFAQGPDTIVTLTSNGDGTFTSAGFATIPGEEGFSIRGKADLNGDGRADLVISSTDGGGFATNVLLSNGAGGFTVESLAGVARGVRFEDLSGNGSLDFITSSGDVYTNDGS